MARTWQCSALFDAVFFDGAIRILKDVETLTSLDAATRIGSREQASSPPPAQVRIAYLLSQYPAVSHTFFLHEVLGLRARGMEIETASINRPDRAQADLPPLEAAEAQSTFYVKNGGRWAALNTLLSVLLLQPQVVLRGLRAVFGVPQLPWRKRLFWLLYLAEALLVGRWMQKRGLKHLHVHFAGPVASVGMLTAAAWQLPWSLTIHGPEELLNVDAYQLRQKVASAGFVFCISDFCRSQLCQLAEPGTWAKFKVIRLGVDPVTLVPSSREPANAEVVRLPELVCTGRLVAAKGHRILLQALLLLRERGLCIKATLIGGGPELAALQEFVAAHDMAAEVVFTGALSHPATLSHFAARRSVRPRKLCRRRAGRVDGSHVARPALRRDDDRRHPRTDPLGRGRIVSAACECDRTRRRARVTRARSEAAPYARSRGPAGSNCAL